MKIFSKQWKKYFGKCPSMFNTANDGAALDSSLESFCVLISLSKKVGFKFSIQGHDLNIFCSPFLLFWIWTACFCGCQDYLG